MSTVQLEIKNVNKVYNPGKRKEHLAIENISFDITKGEFVCLLGASGCGKTTLLSMIAGFIPVTKGGIYLNGNLVTKPGPDRGFVFQSYALFPWMTVLENVMYPLKMQKVKRNERKERALELIEMAGLTDAIEKYPANLSGGMRQRTAVARALAGNPEMLLLDEPLSAIDFQMRQTMQAELSALLKTANTTVVMVTHDVDEAVYLSDRVIVMASGGGHMVADHTIPLGNNKVRKSAAYQKQVDILTDYLRQANPVGKTESPLLESKLA